MYKLQEYDNGAAAVSISITDRVTKLKFTHLLFQIRGVALIATELPKIILNATISGINKNIITNVSLLNFAYYSDMLGGVGLNSTTDAYILIPLGSLDTHVQDLNYSIKSTSALAAQQFNMNVYAVRLDEEMDLLEYEYRAIPTTNVTFDNVYRIYDTATAYNSAVNTVLTFPNNSQMTIPHKMAFALCQAQSKLESQNTFGTVFSDKDLDQGRQVTLLASAAWNALIISYSKLNG